jgi:pimeloyl-ACP methyl ester carboxylesterase
MSERQASAGYFPNGVPYNRIGHGARLLVILQGLLFEHKPATGIAARFALSIYSFLQEAFTVYLVGPRPGLPQGYTLQDIAADYAEVIREQFAGPVDVLGTSTGGSIAQHLAADHPELVRRLVLHATAHTLGETGRAVQRDVARLAGEGRWREASASLLELVFPGSGLASVTRWISSRMMALTPPRDPSDLTVVIRAEDAHRFQARLAEIAAPTLVIDGARDLFYSETLLRETAEGIPDARLILYPDKGHAAVGKVFQRDVLTFLLEGQGRWL